MITLEDKLYTSPEVAKILNVTLRTLYRYIERGYLSPDVQLMSGRYRFSKKVLEEFLSKKKEEKKVEEGIDREEVVEKETSKKGFFPSVQSGTLPVEDAASGDVKSSSQLSDFKPYDEDLGFRFYKSPFNSLKTIAKIINQTSKARGIPYAFTMEGGLSLYQATEPFSIVYTYVRDEGPFIAALQAEASTKEESTICLVPTEEESIFSTAVDQHGLTVVSKDKLSDDLRKIGKEGMLEGGAGL